MNPLVKKVKMYVEPSTDRGLYAVIPRDEVKELLNYIEELENITALVSEPVTPPYFLLPRKGIDIGKIIEDLENHLMLQALERTWWNKEEAAKLLRMKRTTLMERIKKRNLNRRDKCKQQD